jgi:hypothetical protein
LRDFQRGLKGSLQSADAFRAGAVSMASREFTGQNASLSLADILSAWIFRGRPQPTGRTGQQVGHELGTDERGDLRDRTSYKLRLSIKLRASVGFFRCISGGLTQIRIQTRLNHPDSICKKRYPLGVALSSLRFHSAELEAASFSAEAKLDRNMSEWAFAQLFELAWRPWRRPLSKNHRRFLTSGVREWFRGRFLSKARYGNSVSVLDWIKDPSNDRYFGATRGRTARWVYTARNRV